MFNTFLDPVFNPLLGLAPVWIIMIIALIISVLVTLIYKFTTNQSLMKDLKQELKEFQKEIKALRDKPEQALAVQKKAMETNMKYMSHSMKSTLFTLLPVIIIFLLLCNLVIKSSHFGMFCISSNIIKFTSSYN